MSGSANATDWHENATAISCSWTAVEMNDQQTIISLEAISIFGFWFKGHL
jgi:hypothetical protein